MRRGFPRPYTFVTHSGNECVTKVYIDSCYKKYEGEDDNVHPPIFFTKGMK